MYVEFKTEFSDKIANLIHNLFFKMAEDHEYEDKEKGLRFLREKYSIDEIKKWNYDKVITIWEQTKFIGFGRAKDNGWITHLYIDTPYGGKGLGSELLSKLEKYLIENNHKVVYLNSESKALDFYIKRGYESNGPTKIQEGIKQVPLKKVNFGKY